MNTYLNSWSSLMNVATRFKAANPTLNFGDIVDFDDSDGEKLPLGNLTGIYQFDYTEDNGSIYAQCTFPVTTEADVSSVLLNEAVGKFANFVRVGTYHPYYNYVNGVGTVVGTMKASNKLSVSPMVRTSNRQYKFILQGFVFDQAAKP